MGKEKIVRSSGLFLAPCQVRVRGCDTVIMIVNFLHVISLGRASNSPGYFVVPTDPSDSSLDSRNWRH